MRFGFYLKEGTEEPFYGPRLSIGRADVRKRNQVLRIYFWLISSIALRGEKDQRKSFASFQLALDFRFIA